MDATNGTPRVKLSPAFGPEGETRYASHVSGSGAAALVFRYALVEGDNSGGATVSVGENALQLNGGSISAGATDVHLDHGGVNNGKEVKAARPGVVNVFAFPALTEDYDQDGQDDTFVENDTINFTLEFSPAIVVANQGTGGANVKIVVTVGTTDHTLAHISNSSTKIQFGARTVVAGDIDRDGITVKRDASGNPVRLSGGGTIRSVDGGNDADLKRTPTLGVRAKEDQATPLARVRGTNAAPATTDFSRSAAKDADYTPARSAFPITDGDALKRFRW